MQSWGGISIICHVSAVGGNKSVAVAGQRAFISSSAVLSAPDQQIGYPTNELPDATPHGYDKMQSYGVLGAQLLSADSPPSRVTRR